MRAWPVLGIAIIQSILLLAHLFLYFTWTSFCGVPSEPALIALRAGLLMLAFSFVAGTLLSHYYAGSLATGIYRIAAVWLGFLNYLFFGACLTRLAWLALEVTHSAHNRGFERPLIGWLGIALGAVTAIFGIANAHWVRVRRIAVPLPGLPPAWRGRTALVASDLHLGNINGAPFAQRIVDLAAQLKPDIIFLPGDVFDGARVDPVAQTAPFKHFTPPFGAYFATGNHDEFGDTPRYLAALKGAGVRVLSNEKTEIDGLQILGVPYHDGTSPIRMKASLEAMKIDRARASILINHVPNRLPIVEQAGVSLQLSGHTHGGQFAPFTWLTRRIFGEFTYGLHRFGALQVFTSYGAGTWGPPLRVGTTPEVVLVTFE